MARTNAQRLEVLDGGRPEQIVADSSHHVRLGPAETRRHRLIGPLPPKPRSKRSPKIVSPAGE
jgi:hypothetical protein